MIKEIIPITSEAQWLALRGADLTSTAISCLWGLSPYQTVFELYHAKRNGIILPFKDNERMQKGKRMEQYAAQEVMDKYGWAGMHAEVYVRIPELKLGSSFDYFVTCPERGKGILEIKAVDKFQHDKKWDDDEIPPHIEIQARHQMLCADLDWVCVSAHTSIYESHEYFLTRDKEYENGIIAAAKKFWADVAAGIEPEADFSRDGDVISALYKNATGEADLTGDNELPTLLSEYKRISDEAKVFEDKKEAMKNEIHAKLGNTARGYTADAIVDAAWTKGSAGKVVTEDMVGNVIGQRAAYRKLLIKPYGRDRK